MIKLANQNELPHWHHLKSTNGIKAGPPDKKRQWQCVHLIHRLRNIREEAVNGLSCLCLNQMLCFVWANRCSQGHKDTYWSEELWSGDGGTVTVEFNPTAQIKIANLHRRNLQETSEQEIISAPKWLSATDRHDYAFTVCLWKPQIIWSNFLNHKCKVHLEFLTSQTCCSKRLTLCSCSHKMFSGFRSRWAIPTRAQTSHALVVWYSG